MTDLSFPPLRPCCPTFDHEPHQPDCDTVSAIPSAPQPKPAPTEENDHA